VQLSNIPPTGWLILSLVLVVLPATSAAVAYWLMRRWSGKRVLCAKCRYPATGLRIARCPECGSDLREVGLVTYGVPIRRFTVAFVFIWALVAVGIPAICAGQIVTLLPWTTDRQSLTRFQQPHSGAYADVYITVMIRTRDGWFGPSRRSPSIEWRAVFRSNDIDASLLEVPQSGTFTTVRSGEIEIHHPGLPSGISTPFLMPIPLCLKLKRK
jgi:hypothetical protein